MKKSFLALSAAAVVGGLGLATSAQAVYYIGNGDLNNTTAGLELSSGSIGHELIVPYFSAQGNTNTLLSIVNTDQTNGKAVKVRFRGAANSDDVLDFTILLSPADVWTGTISQGAGGLATLTSTDNSCTLPSNGALRGGVTFSTLRLPGYLTAAQQAANTREGYVEILNMADIPPQTASLIAADNASTSGTAWAGSTYDGVSRQAYTANNDLYTAIKHVNGTPPCQGKWQSGGNKGIDALQALLDTYGQGAKPNNSTGLLANYGLGSPTGGLMGSWMLINQDTLAQFSGNDVAVRAYTAVQDVNGAGHPAVTDVLFSPQIDTQIHTGIASDIPNAYTADPLLTGSGGYNATVPTLYFDLPDLSTPFNYSGNSQSLSAVSPYTESLATPDSQAYALASALGKTTIFNEFVNDANGAATGVPQNTDWIVSQPTRRYFAVLNYGASATTATTIYNDGWTSNRIAVFGKDLPYSGAPGTVAGVPGRATTTPTDPAIPTWQPTVDGNLQINPNTAYGPQLCLKAIIGVTFDREETSAVVSNNAQFSPKVGAQPNYYCGEVATLSWGNSPTGAALTNSAIVNPYTSGWASLGVTTNAANGLPIIGYSAESATNSNTKTSFGLTLPHRWQ